MYSDKTTGLYTSMETFKADAETLLANFDAKYWTIEKGSLAFKSALTLLPTAINFTNSETEILGGTSLNLKTDRINFVTYSLKEAVTGIAVSGNILSAESTVAPGTVTVFAKYTHPIFGITFNA